MSSCQSLVHDCDDVLIRQHRVGVFHPVFAKIAHFFGDQPVAKAELRSAHLNHAVLPSTFDAAPDVANHD